MRPAALTVPQSALVLHPDDLLFRRFRERIEREQEDAGRESNPSS